jgi:hypothetical protein
MGPENISENFGDSHHCKNLKYENFGESQLKMATPWFTSRWVARISESKDIFLSKQ